MRLPSGGLATHPNRGPELLAGPLTECRSAQALGHILGQRAHLVGRGAPGLALHHAQPLRDAGDEGLAVAELGGQGGRTQLGQGMARLLDRAAARRDAVEDQGQPCASPWRPARPCPGSPRRRACSAGTGTRMRSAPRIAALASISVCGGVSTRIRSASRLSRSISTPSRQPPIIEKRSSGASRWRCSRRRIQPVRLPCGSMSTRATCRPSGRQGRGELDHQGRLARPALLLGHRHHAAMAVPNSRPSVAARPVDQVRSGRPSRSRRRLSTTRRPRSPGRRSSRHAG